MLYKIVIFGSNGMLGNYIKLFFEKNINYQVIPLTRKDYDINLSTVSKLDELFDKLSINSNTCIINCSGLIPQRHMGDDNNYYIINTVFPLQLSKISNKYNAKLICPTTDCVYTGKKGNYVESDFHDELNSYGISKSLGEPNNATVIRVSIIGEEKENKCSFLEFVKNSSGTINGWSNHLWNGITCLQYCKIIEQIIKENLFWKGVRHIYSPDTKSKYELACIIKNVYNIPININKYDAVVCVDKTLKSEYDTNDLFNISSLEQQITEQSKFNLV